MAGNRVATILLCSLLGCENPTPAPVPTPPTVHKAAPAIASTPVTPPVASAASAVARVVRTEGDVRVQRAGTTSWQRATDGMSLEPHDTIQALDGSAEVHVPGSGATIQLAAKTTLRMPRTFRASITPLEGKVTARVTIGDSGHDELRVDLPPGMLVLSAAADRHPTVEAAIELTPDDSAIEMTQGTAALASRSGAEIPLTAKRWARLRPDGTITDEGESGPVAQLVSPEPAAAIKTTGLVELEWTPLPGIDRYTVSLITGTAKREIDADTPRLKIRLATGSYRWHVRGRQGELRWPRSPIRSFQVEVDDVPPPLEVVSPADQAQVHGPSVRIVGRSEPGATIEIKGARTRADGRGQFSLEVPITRGLSNLVVRARDAMGNERRQARSVVWP